MIILGSLELARSRGVARILHWGGATEAERRRRENRGTGGAEWGGVGNGEGVSRLPTHFWHI